MKRNQKKEIDGVVEQLYIQKLGDLEISQPLHTENSKKSCSDDKIEDEGGHIVHERIIGIIYEFNWFFLQKEMMHSQSTELMGTEEEDRIIVRCWSSCLLDGNTENFCCEYFIFQANQGDPKGGSEITRVTIPSTASKCTGPGGKPDSVPFSKALLPSELLQRWCPAKPWG